MLFKRKTFFERLTGSARLDEDDELLDEPVKDASNTLKKQSTTNTNDPKKKDSPWTPEEEEGQLSVDVYQTATEIVVQTMVAGVRPEDLQIQITRDMVVIRGRREPNRTIDDSNYFAKELYWGAFSRTISLPQEIESEEAEAVEKHGLLMIRLPKIDKNKQTTLRVKAM